MWRRQGVQGAPPEKELVGEPELRPLPRIEAEGEVRMAERSSRPSNCRILHETRSSIQPLYVSPSS